MASTFVPLSRAGRSMAFISIRDILRFYLPLVLNSQMMTLTGPIINLAVGRAADPKLEFAGYWIGFTLLMFIESPCLIVQQVTAALVRDYVSLRRLLAGALTVGTLAATAVLVVARTSLGDWVFDWFIHTTPRAEALSREVLAALFVVPILISLRGVGNGVAIRERKTLLVARATLFRVLALSVVVSMAVFLHTGSGAMAGVAALVSGLTLETIMIWIGVFPIARRMRAEHRGAIDNLPDDLPGDRRLLEVRFPEIGRVALPLVFSAVAWTAFRPLVNAILGRLDDPELAQAGFGVVMPLILLMSSPLWSIQHVSLVLPENRRDLDRVIRFTAATAAFFGVGVLLVTMTPLRGLILQRGFALSEELERVVVPALFLIVFEPFFLAARSISQGLMMKAKRTEAFMVFAPLKILLIATAGFTVVRWVPDVNGALLGTALYVGGDLFDGIVYSATARRLLRSRRVFEEAAPVGVASTP